MIWSKPSKVEPANMPANVTQMVGMTRVSSAEGSNGTSPIIETGTRAFSAIRQKTTSVVSTAESHVSTIYATCDIGELAPDPARFWAKINRFE